MSAKFICGLWGRDPTSRQELHYGDTAMAFAALTGCMEVHRYGTHLGNPKALTKAESNVLATV